jgi:5-(carboxyamino)imidazole ribonucleotide synthase
MSHRSNNVILPGSTIGIFGGGQLGRMTAMAARSLGYRIQVIDPDPACPARFVVDNTFTASLDDVDAAEDLARGCDVITIEIEKVGIAALNEAAKHAPTRPNSAALEIIQHRARQKDWLIQNGFPVGPSRRVTSAAELERAARELGAKEFFVKAAQGGYDGRGQALLHTPEDAHKAWLYLGAEVCVIEVALDLDFEISVLAARNPSGDCVAFPPALNHHTDRILDWSVLPAPIDSSLAEEATSLAKDIITKLDLVGLLCVEMFVTKEDVGARLAAPAKVQPAEEPRANNQQPSSASQRLCGERLFVNELAPRPHNSYHASERACATSQFEQCVRAICNLPLGDTSILKPAAIINLLGDLWLEHSHPAFDKAMSVPGVRVHLYEKEVPKKGRKMGHLSAVADTPDEAVKRVQEAKAILDGKTSKTSTRI